MCIAFKERLYVEPIEEDIRLSLELVADSLSSSLQEQLFAAYGKAVGDVLINKHVTAAKRKADWEQEMEVRIICGTV